MSYNSVGLALQQPEHFGASINFVESGVTTVPRVWKRGVLHLNRFLWPRLSVVLEFPLDVRRPTTVVT